MSDEAHFPAEQARSRAAPRLPLADGDGGRPQGAECPPRPRPQEAVGLSQPLLGRVTRRADYLAANRALRAPMPGFVLLVRPRGDGDPQMRVGITVSGKVGGAVIRNRMKRRFRELARALLPERGIPGADHILIGRKESIERDYALLRTELEKALQRLKKKSSPGRGGGPPPKAVVEGADDELPTLHHQPLSAPRAPSTSFAGPPPRSGEELE